MPSFFVGKLVGIFPRFSIKRVGKYKKIKVVVGYEYQGLERCSLKNFD